MSLPNVIERWLRVFEGSFDLDEYETLFTEDVSFRDAGTGQSSNRLSDLVEFARAFTQLSDGSVKMLRHATSGDDVFVEVEYTATAPTGDRITSRGVAIFTVTDGKISAVTTYLFREGIKT